MPKETVGAPQATRDESDKTQTEDRRQAGWISIKLPDGYTLQVGDSIVFKYRVQSDDALE